MNKVIISTIIVFITCLIGCNVVDNNSEIMIEQNKNLTVSIPKEKQDISIEEVVFLNEYETTIYRTTALLKYNELHSTYDEINAETLYAYNVDIDHYGDGKLYPQDYPIQEGDESFQDYALRCHEYEVGEVKRLLLQEEVMLLADTKEIIVICTMQEAERLFDNTRNLEGWYLYVTSALRPDVEMIIKKVSDVAKPASTIEEWFQVNKELAEREFGVEEQIAVEVSVITE